VLAFQAFLRRKMPCLGVLTVSSSLGFESASLRLVSCKRETGLVTDISFVRAQPTPYVTAMSSMHLQRASGFRNGTGRQWIGVLNKGALSAERPTLSCCLLHAVNIIRRECQTACLSDPTRRLASSPH
jgi:hypothetical protein